MQSKTFRGAWRIIFFVIAVALVGQVSRADGEIADRAVVEINGSSYMQRQLEMYLALKTTIGKVTDPKRALPSQDNWTACIDEFKNDMIIEQEAQRLGSFQPTRKMIDTALAMVVGKRRGWPELDAFLLQMKASEQTMRRTLASVLRVKGFIVSRDRQRLDAGKHGSSEMLTSSDWFEKLEQRTPFRIYEGAKGYLEIHPVGSSSKRTR